jgi:hypothetical protein
MGTVRDDTHTFARPRCLCSWPRPVRLPGQPHGTGHISLYASSAYTNARARVQEDSSSSASSRRCLSVSAPNILVSLMWCRARNFLHLVVPQRRWLISSSPIAHVSAASGGSRMTSAAAASPSAILRFSSARANRTAFARSSARSRCGAGLTVAVSDIWCFVSSHPSAWADLDFYERAGVNWTPSRGSCTAHCFSARRSARFVVHPRFRPSLPFRPPALLGRLGRGRSYAIRADNSNVTSAGHALRACFFCERAPCASVDKAAPQQLIHICRSRRPTAGLTHDPGAVRARIRNSVSPRRTARGRDRACPGRAWP